MLPASAITCGYREALQAHGLKAFFGHSAAIQPGKLQEVLLHETSVAWMRLRRTKTLPRRPWDETVEEYRARLKVCAAYANERYNIESLCRALPQRLRLLRERKGDRLAK